jgi:LPS-assembly protein
MRNSLLLLILLAASLSPALGQGGIDLTSDAPIQYDDATKEVVALGGARLVYGEYTLLATEIRYNQETGIATARGGITLTHGAVRILAQSGEYSTGDGRVRLRNVKAGMSPVYITAESAEGTVREFTFTNAVVNFGEPDRMTPRITSRRITWKPGNRIGTEGAGVRIGSVPVFGIPGFERAVGDTFFDISLRGGYRSTLGPYLNITALAPFSESTSLGAGIGIFGSRGVLVGPAANYEHATEGSSVRGRLRSGYISDGGDRGTDILGEPIESNRGYVEWRHQQTSGNLSLTGYLNYWSDSEVIRDFNHSEFSRLQQPDTFLEAAWVTDNFIFSAFLRPHLNPFHPIQQRLPEIRLDLLPTPVLGRMIHRGSASAVRLREDAIRTGTDLESDRLDVHYGLSRPFALAPWLTFTPVAGGRITHYADVTDGSGSYTRYISELGADVRARAWREFDYKNETWGIDGLRHIVEPFAQYRTMPAAGNGSEKLVQIDRNVFGTRLQPLGLGDIRSIDDMRDLNILRVGVDQRLQTRDGAGGSRDLASLVLAIDHNFRRDPGIARRSALQIEASLAPVRWLRFDVFSQLDLDNPTLEELNTGITIIDGRHWSFGASTHYLRGDLEEYDLRVTRRINEEFSVGARFRYDATTSSLYEQTYSLRQNIRNLWAVEYQVSWHERLRRESGFHFRVVVDLLRF